MRVLIFILCLFCSLNALAFNYQQFLNRNVQVSLKNGDKVLGLLVEVVEFSSRIGENRFKGEARNVRSDSKPNVYSKATYGENEYTSQEQMIVVREGVTDYYIDVREIASIGVKKW